MMITSKQNTSDVPKCRLCKNADASSIGSHIINRELINWVINAPGEKNKVDKENAFIITPGFSVDTYFGRRTDNNNIEKTLGRTMSEEEIVSNKSKHLFVKPYFLCANCEKRLERIESYFMRNVHDNLRTSKFALDYITEDYSQIQLAGLNSELIRLYCYSIVWRCLEANIINWNYDNCFKKSLREMLDDNLSIDLDVVIKNANENVNSINKYPLIINYLTTTANHDENNIYLHKFKNPYFIWAGDITILLFSNRQSVKCYNNSLFGLSKFKTIRSTINHGISPLRIGVISEHFRKNHIIFKCAKYFAKLEFKETKEDITKTYAKFLKIPRKKTLDNIVKMILREYNDERIPVGVRYTPQRKIDIYMRYFAQVINSSIMNNNQS